MTKTYDLAFLDKQYSARAAVPDHARILADWKARSARVRQSHRGYLDRAYGESGAEMLDIFLPRGESRALLMYIHGGYWRALNKSDFSYLAPAFTDAGVTLAVVNYGLAPQVNLYEIVLQNCRAVVWLYRNAQDYGADPGKLYVCGHSAGGHLTAMMLAAIWPQLAPDLPKDLVKGGLALSGLYDLEPLRHAPFLKDDIRLDASAAANLSPVRLPPATDASLYTAVGGRESAEFHRQTRTLEERWSPVFRENIPMPDDNHFTLNEKLGDASSPLFAGALKMMGIA
jgi:arylformamidase